MLAGLVAIKFRLSEAKRMNLLLAFSGAFLLCITLLHLLPESIESQGHRAGMYILIGFFLQLIIQRFTHGIEHGHSHHFDSHEHKTQFGLILSGLSVHAFMEGLPLGFNYSIPTTDLSLYFAIAIHKLPEGVLAAALIRSFFKKSWVVVLWLIIFSALTPFASLIATYFGSKYLSVNSIIEVIIPIVAGVFIHIATTIFYESGTKQHSLSFQKIIAIILGLLMGSLSLFSH